MAEKPKEMCNLADRAYICPSGGRRYVPRGGRWAGESFKFTLSALYNRCVFDTIRVNRIQNTEIHEMERFFDYEKSCHYD